MHRVPRFVRVCATIGCIAWIADPATASQTANLIVNPDAETGDLTGWADPLGNGYGVTTTFVNSGTYAFWPGVTGPSGSAWNNEIRQDVDVSAYASIIDAGSMNSEFEGWGRSNEAGGFIDNGRIVVEYRSNASMLASFDSGDIRPTHTWVQVSDARVLPVGTRIVRIRLLADRPVGASTDGGQDDLSLRLDSPLLDVPAVHRRFALGPVRPNPARSVSEMELTLERPMRVALSVVDVRGRVVHQLMDERRDAGRVRVTWDGLDRDDRPAPPGLYFYAGRIGEHAVARRVTVVR